jgi:hypothetical protein
LFTWDELQLQKRFIAEQNKLIEKLKKKLTNNQKQKFGNIAAIFYRTDFIGQRIPIFFN